MRRAGRGRHCPRPHRAQTQIDDHVGEQPADQKLERKVINPLAASGETFAVRRQPAVNNAIAQRQGGCEKPVAVGSGRWILAEGGRELGEHGRLELLDVFFGCRPVGDGGWSSRFARIPLASFLHATIVQDSSDASLAEVRCHRLALSVPCSKCLLATAAERQTARNAESSVGVGE